MPTYEYKCSIDSNHKFVEIRGITEEASRETCAEKGCKGRLVRVFSAPPITFKGGGFHAKSG